MSSFDKPEPKKKLSAHPQEFEEDNVYKNLGDKQKIKGQTELTPDEIFAILNKIEAESAINPKAELDQLQASLLYQIDQDLPSQDLQDKATYIKTVRGFSKGMSDEQLRNLPDYEQVKSLIRLRLESEKNIVDTSNALQEVMEILGIEGYTPATYINKLKEMKPEWEERGVFDYLTIELIKNNSRHNIVPVPNAEFSAEQLFKLAKDFGKHEDEHGNIVGQPFETNVYDEEYPEPLYSQYTPAELSGPVQPDQGPLRLYLIPSKLNPRFAGKIVEVQRATLASQQQQYPSLNFQDIPPVVAVAYWYVLRAGGDKLNDDSAWEKTSLRNFSLKAKRLRGYSCVPKQQVFYGRPSLDVSDADYYDARSAGDGRVAVG